MWQGKAPGHPAPSPMDVGFAAIHHPCLAVCQSPKGSAFPGVSGCHLGQDLVLRVVRVTPMGNECPIKNVQTVKFDSSVHGHGFICSVAPFQVQQARGENARAGAEAGGPAPVR